MNVCSGGGFRQQMECVLANNNVNHLVVMLYARAALAIFTPFTLCAVLFSLELSLGTRTGLAMQRGSIVNNPPSHFPDIPKKPRRQEKVAHRKRRTSACFNLLVSITSPGPHHSVPRTKQRKRSFIQEISQK